MPDEEQDIIPRVEEIAFTGVLIGTLDQVMEKLSNIPFFSLKMDKGALNIARVESRDIKKRPFLFYMINIRPEGVSVVYSILPDTSEKLRRLYIIKSLASVLSIISKQYQIDYQKFFQYVDSSIDDALNGMSASYSNMFNKYDALLMEYRELKKQNLELGTSNKTLVAQVSQLDNDNKQLSEDLKALQTYSDETLMAMIEDWIETHNSSIDVTEFSQNYKLAAPRVEQILNKMVSLGYIEVRG